MADREAEIHDKALDAIDEAIDKFRSDMRATEKKRIDGDWVEVPVWRMTPKDLAVLIDRLMVLLDRPSHIREGITPTSEAVPVDVFKQIVELTRGRAEPASQASPIPRSMRHLDD